MGFRYVLEQPPPRGICKTIKLNGLQESSLQVFDNALVTPT
jgi:hypothetical protein